MCPPLCPEDETVYDLIGLGFGPANLAIAGALLEKWGASTGSTVEYVPTKMALFIEKHERFRWHPGMLLPDARMQISFMKDLATLRSPQSPITFLSYLHSQNRLVAFINRGSTIPTRKEYADYLSWAAQFVQEKGVDVMYGHEVIAINEGPNDTIEVRSRNIATGEENIRRTRDIVISPGGSARIPESLSSISKHTFVIHSSTYITSIGDVLGTLAKESRPLRIAVIGSGQSAAEVTMNLRERLSSIPNGGHFGHEVDMIIRKGSVKPSDDSPFSNEVFDPSATDDWFSMPSRRIRDTKLAEYKSTNYGVVNPRTLDVLYEIIYDQKVDDGIAQRTNNLPGLQARINLRTYSSILSAELTKIPQTGVPTDVPCSAFNIITQNSVTREISEQKYDAVVCATGYQRSSWIDLLKASEIGKHFGLHASTPAASLIPSSSNPARQLGADSAFDIHDNLAASETPSPSTGSSISTPPTSPGPSIFSSVHLEQHLPSELFISRSYRLLPILTDNSKAGFQPRVYLQGVEEATHGLSDTLLSVLGVRAGEVVADLCSAR